MPLWAAILIAIGVYSAIASPFHQIQHAARYGAPSPAEAWLHAWINLMWLAFIAFSIWWGFHHVPQVHDFIEQLFVPFQRALH